MEQNFFVNTSVLLIFFILARTFFSSSIKPYQESLEALKYMASLSLSRQGTERKNLTPLPLTLSDRFVMPLGLEDKRVTDGSLTASTYYNHHLSPWHGRLNSRWSWSVRRNRRGEWFQVNFVELMRIKGVATQGRQDASQWVRSYTIMYSVDGMNFVSYKEGRTTKVNV